MSAPLPSTAPPSAESPAPGWLSGRRFLLALFCCVLLGALLRPFPAAFKFRHGGDCVRYLNWSHTVAADGLAAFPRLVVEYRQRWVGFPPPTRWSYLLLIAGIMKAWPAPADDYHPLVLVSWSGGVLALAALGLWLRRLTKESLALLAVLLCATAPVPRALSHFPLPDSLYLLVCLTLFWVVTEWLVQPRRWLLPLVAGLAFLSVTVRESGLIGVIAAGALVLAKRRRDEPWKKGVLPPGLALFAGCLLALLCTFFLAGGPVALFLLARDVIHGAIHTGNSAFVGGPYYRYLVDLMIIAPVMTVTAIAAAAPLAHNKELRPLLLAVGVPALTFLLAYSFLPKAMRYIMPVEFCARTLCAAAVYLLWAASRRAMALLLLGALLGHDLVLFWRVWGQDQIYDPVTWNLARQLGMIP